MNFDFVIIGSGLGGLLSGFLLSKEGKNVCVLEQNNKLGGNFQSFDRAGHSFDTGIHYLGSLLPGQILYNYWKYFGLTDLPGLTRMDEKGFDIISFQGAEFPVAQGFENFSEQLLPFFPDARKALSSYTSALENVAANHPLYHLELPLAESNKHSDSVTAWSMLKKISSGVSLSAPGIPLTSVLAGNNLLYAGNPSTTPLHQYALINHSFISSAWRIAGGSQIIVDKLVKGIRDNGGTVIGKKQVNRITKKEGVFCTETADGDHFFSKKIISGIHPSATLKMIDGITMPKAYSQRIFSTKNTVSALCLYLGLKPRSFRYMNHNLYHHTTDQIWTSENVTDHYWPGSFLLMTPPRIGQDHWADTAVILSPMRFSEFNKWEKSKPGHRDSSYRVFRSQKAHLLLECVFSKFPNLRMAISSVDLSTPLTWRDYTGSPDGSMYGVVRDATDPFRSTIFPKTKIPGLFFTGQNINIHGAIGVTIGAVMTCGEILGLPHVLKTIKNAL